MKFLWGGQAAARPGYLFAISYLEHRVGSLCLATIQNFPMHLFLLLMNGALTSGQVDPKCGARLESSTLTGAALWCFPTRHGRLKKINFRVMEGENMPEEIKAEQYTYQVNNVNFVVTPVYKDRGEAITAILLRLMKADTEQVCATSTSLTRAGVSSIL
ncbi:hypothetical protein ACVS9P_02025 [Caproicibacterium sp. NSD3]